MEPATHEARGRLLDGIVTAQVPTTAIVVGALVLLVAATDRWTSAPEVAALVTPLAILTGVLLLGFGLLVAKRPLPQWAGSPALTLMGLLLVANDMVRTYATADPTETAVWLLVVIGAGALMIRTPWLLTFCALTLVAWFATLGVDAALGDWASYTRALVIAGVFSVVIQQFRTRSTLQLELARAAEGDLRRRVESAEKAARHEKQRLATILEAAGEGVIVTSSDGRVVLANKSATALLGWDDLTDWAPGTFHAKAHPSDEEGRPCDPESCPLMGGPGHETRRGRANLTTTTGDRIPVLYSTSSIVAPDGERFGVTVFRDMRAESDARAAQRTAQERFEHLFHQAPIGLAILDSGGLFLQTNPALLQFLRRAEDEVVGRSPHEFTHPDDASGPSDTATEGVLKGALGGVSFTHRYLMPDDEVVWGRVTLAPLKGPDGHIVGALGIIADMTDEKRREAAVERERIMVVARADELERVNRELEAFSYSASHDLRAPLRAISTLSLMLDEELESAQVTVGREFITRIQTEVARTRQLVDDLMLLSRAGQTELSIGEVDITSMATDIARTLNEHAKRPVTIHVEPDMRDQADAGLLRIVFENLLGNAWKYMRDTSEPRVNVGRESHDGVWVYHVRDNGIGFSDNEAGRIFQPFTRLAGAKEFPGTGVGLATVQRIVQRHGGRVWAEGKQGEGATFYLTLGDAHAQRRNTAAAWIRQPGRQIRPR